jgi:hypothetical protein
MKCDSLRCDVLYDIIADVYVDCFFCRCLERVREIHNKNKTNSVTLVRKRTIPTERPPLVGEVSANLNG